jgi:hypothetical protein
MNEEELKNRLRPLYFSNFDANAELGKIDFTVTDLPSENEPILARDKHWYLWAESKRGHSANIQESFVQLILTIGKEKTNERELPPTFLGAFDAEKIAFIEYNKIMYVFSLNDFNWNVTPSDHQSKEFKLLYDMVCDMIVTYKMEFHYATEEKALVKFISDNFRLYRTNVRKMPVTKSNFVAVYLRWRKEVLPSIAVDWKDMNKIGLFEHDFFLADLMSSENRTIIEKLHVLLEDDKYIADRKINPAGFLDEKTVSFRKGGIFKHRGFWNKYQRPPKEEYQEYIIERRDLLVPQDIRERKGSFFTPKIWVEKSQEYLENTLGPDWQQEYFIWDCCCGTANLERGLTEPSRVWASTLDEADVKIVKELISKELMPSLLESHVFQFDFLNSSFNELPMELRNVIEKTPEKLIIYINPPYAEVSSKDIKGKVGVNLSNTHLNYSSMLGTAGRELFAQFFLRISCELKGCILAEFSTLKILLGSEFIMFRKYFTAQLKNMFVVPANTFDNVKGQFPIAFMIWDTGKNEPFMHMNADVFDKNGAFLCKKGYSVLLKKSYINSWINRFKIDNDEPIGYLDGINGNDFQHNNIVYFTNDKSSIPNPRGIWINAGNLVQCCIYISVRHCIESNWLNDRDQFLCPNDEWMRDITFQADCLIYTIFCGYNKITMKKGVNNWIPYSESEVNCSKSFSSHFMFNYINGNIPIITLVSYDTENLLRHEENGMSSVIHFSSEAQSVIDAGKNLFAYYHSMPDSKADASYYDIRSYFQGFNEKGVMNHNSEDGDYNKLIDILRQAEKVLGDKISSYVYKYGFLLY